MCTLWFFNNARVIFWLSCYMLKLINQFSTKNDREELKAPKHLPPVKAFITELALCTGIRQFYYNVCHRLVRNGALRTLKLHSMTAHNNIYNCGCASWYGASLAAYSICPKLARRGSAYLEVA